MDYADRILDLRTRHGLTRKELAKSSGVSEMGIKNYEKRYRKPAYDGLISLANYFNVSLDYLVGRTDNPIITH